MNLKINLAEKAKTLALLNKVKSMKNSTFDIKISNSHIIELNKKIEKKIFKKESLYISSTTICDLMKPIGGKNQHNYHGLTAEDIYLSLISIKDPQYVFFVKDKRYAIISVKLSSFYYPMMMVIETNSGAVSGKDTSINKIITMYPKSYIDEYIEKLDKRKLLYKKK